MGVSKKKIAQGKNHRPLHVSSGPPPKAYTAMCDQGDVAGSTWILNFQPVRRCYVTRRRQTTSIQLHYAHGPGRTELGACASKVLPAG